MHEDEALYIQCTNRLLCNDGDGWDIGRIVNEEVFIMVMCMRGKRLYLVRYFISLEGETIIYPLIWTMA